VCSKALYPLSSLVPHARIKIDFCFYMHDGNPCFSVSRKLSTIKYMSMHFREVGEFGVLRKCRSRRKWHYVGCVSRCKAPSQVLFRTLCKRPSIDLHNIRFQLPTIPSLLISPVLFYVEVLPEQESHLLADSHLLDLLQRQPPCSTAIAVFKEASGLGMRVRWCSGARGSLYIPYIPQGICHLITTMIGRRVR
jgi:hypothetical protein